MVFDLYKTKTFCLGSHLYKSKPITLSKRQEHLAKIPQEQKWQDDWSWAVEGQSSSQHYQESAEDVKEDAEKGPGLRKGQPSQPHQVEELCVGEAGETIY